MTPGMRARALYAAEGMRYRLGDHGRLLSAFEDIVAAFRDEGHLVGAADTLMTAGLASVRAGDATLAAKLLSESHQIFGSIGDEQGRAMTLVFLGTIPLSRGEYAQAEEYFERGLALARRSGDPFGMSPALYHLALATRGSGHYERACRYYREFSVLSERMKDRPNAAYALVGLAECWGARGTGTRRAPLRGCRRGVRERGHVVPPLRHERLVPRTPRSTNATWTSLAPGSTRRRGSRPGPRGERRAPSRPWPTPSRKKPHPRRQSATWRTGALRRRVGTPVGASEAATMRDLHACSGAHPCESARSCSRGGGTRTHTEGILSPLPLPIGLRPHAAPEYISRYPGPACSSGPGGRGRRCSAASTPRPGSGSRRRGAGR